MSIDGLAEVLVVGGGPAGLAAAIAAAQAGFTVEVAEPCTGPSSCSDSRLSSRGGSQARRQAGTQAGTQADTQVGLRTGSQAEPFPPTFLPIDKCCGEGLLPPALDALSALGISPFALARHSAPILGIHFQHGSHHARAGFAPGSPGAGMRRLHLHALLVQRAQALGVTITAAPARVRLHSIQGRPAFQVGGQSRGPLWIIGADGNQSATRDAMGLDRGRLHSQRFALRQHFSLRPAQVLEYVEVHWARGAQAYLTPIGEGAASVAIVSGRRFASMHAALAPFPALRARLGPPLPTSTPRGAVSCHRKLSSVVHGNFALIGDASGGVDAITGEGLALAFQQALRLAAAMRLGDLSLYQAAHTSLLRTPGLMSRALLAMGAHPALTAAAMAGLSTIPGLFPGLLRLHSGRPAVPSSAVGEAWKPSRPAPNSAA